MICAKPQRTFFYCHRCRHNPDNIDHSAPADELVYPQVEPVSGDCLDYMELTDDE